MIKRTDLEIIDMMLSLAEAQFVLQQELEKLKDLPISHKKELCIDSKNNKVNKIIEIFKENRTILKENLNAEFEREKEMISLSNRIFMKTCLIKQLRWLFRDNEKDKI